jgi:acyl-CoA thioesterase FadM
LGQVSEIAIQYHLKPARVDDALEITASVDTMGLKRCEPSTRKYGGDELLLVKGEFISYCRGR